MTSEEFNLWYRPGTPVLLTDDSGGEHATVTQSEAWDLCGTPVVKVNGHRGGYDLSRIKVMEHHYD
jgi:hypothetical protein